MTHTFKKEKDGEDGKAYVSKMKTLTLKVQLNEEEYYIIKAALKNKQTSPYGIIESTIMAVEEQADDYEEDKRHLRANNQAPVFDENLENYIKLRNRYLKKLQRLRISS